MPPGAPLISPSSPRELSRAPAKKSFTKPVPAEKNIEAGKTKNIVLAGLAVEGRDPPSMESTASGARRFSSEKTLCSWMKRAYGTGGDAELAKMRYITITC